MEPIEYPLLADPACRVRVIRCHGPFALVAAVDIAAGSAILCFDCESNAWDVAQPLAGDCGVARCRGFIRGFRCLDDEAGRQVLPHAWSRPLDHAAGVIVAADPIAVHDSREWACS